MAGWSSGELTTIANAEELELSSQRRDGTLRNPVTMWVVRDGGDLYVRSMHERSGAWFRGTQARHAGHIRAGSIDQDVRFVDIDTGPTERIDAAYRTKYRGYGDAL